MPKNRHHKKSKNSVLSWIKRFWWLIAVAILAALVIGWLLKVHLEKQQLYKRFDTTYTQLEKVYESLRETAGVVPSDDTTIAKQCKKHWFGLSSMIECGVYVDISSHHSMSSDIKELINTSLSSSGFQSIEFRHDTQAELGNIADRVSFKTQVGMVCSGYWVNRSLVEISLYCRETVPDFIPGYEEK